MSNLPPISIVIVSWNVADSLHQCLQSILATSYPKLEIFVIDNASTDSSTKVIKSYSPKVKLIANTSNLGFPKSVNIGLRQITGDFILILNPDTVIPKSFFIDALKFLSQHPDCGVMGPKFLNPDGTTQGSVFPEPSILNTFNEFWLSKTGLTDKYLPTSSQDVFAVSGGCMFFSKYTLKKVGLFTEKVFMYFEDLDYCRRIHAAGLKVLFNPDISITHEHGQSASQNPLSQNWRGYLWESSKWYNGFLKHYLMVFISWTGQKIHYHNHDAKS